MSTALRMSQGRPFPLGASYDGSGVNFALFSAHATRVELCLFDAEERETDEVVTSKPATAPEASC